MLYILGGASRSGKTLFSRRVVVEKQIPYFPLDALVGALAHGAPQFGVQYKDSFVDRANKLWPLATHLFDMLLNEERDYLIEGDSLIPSLVNQLITAGKSARCCFLGYAELNKEEKLSLVRQYHQEQIDWTRGISDEEMLPMIEDMIQFSKYLKEECAKYGVKYFDVSHDFEGVRNSAFEHLFSN